MITPVAEKERIQMLDILRGFAILGILMVNMASFRSPNLVPGFSPSEGEWWDQLAEKFILLFAEGKFYTLFSFLFGLGFAVQMNRAEAKGKSLMSFYPRRLLILFGFGVMQHIFLWDGDILKLYAVLGAVLLFVRHRSDRTLLIAAGGLLLFSFLILAPAAELIKEELSDPQFIEETRQTYLQTNYFDVMADRLKGFWLTLASLFYLQGPGALAMFFLGLAAGRKHLFETPAAHLSLFWRGLRWGLVIGGIGSLMMTFLDSPMLLTFGFVLGAPALSMAYVSAITLLAQHETWRLRLAPLSWVGRMALSNYILHALVCSTIFYGYGLGYYEQVGAAGGLLLTFVIYLLQIPFSRWWLSHFYYGPLEWVWRSLTYGRSQPFRKLQPAAQIR